MESRGHRSMLPQDPMMLLSVVNTKLRDYYPSLQALCEDLEVEEQKIIERLSSIDYVYNAELNRFI